jgi:hypothetical protein
MRYLVTGEYVEPGPLLPPEKVVEMVENAVLPGLQMLAQMEGEGKVVAGGVHASARTGTMIVETDSHDAIDKLIVSLPFWGLLKWTVTPLVTFADRAKWEGEMVAELKKNLKR